MSIEEAKQAEDTWQQMQAELAGLSSRGMSLVAEKNGHTIHIDRPELVVDAIGQVVEAGRLRLATRDEEGRGPTY